MNVQTTIGAGAEIKDTQARPGRFQFELAVADLVEGLRRWELWGTLGWNDIRQRYRRSTIGPFWITISMGVMVGGLSVLWATLFRLSIPDYLPYFALGFITWTLVSSLILEGCTALYTSEGIIKQLPVPLSIHIYRLVWRNLIVTAHNLCIYVVIIAVLQIWPGVLSLLIAALGFALIALNGVAVALIVGILSARFRDIPPIIGSVLQMIFFFSPILWKPEALPPESQYLAAYNPFYHFIEIIRRPLLGGAPELTTWLAVGGMTLVTGAVALVLFARFRMRVAYWI